MADVIDHPDKFTRDKAWPFADGSSVVILAPEGQHLTVCEAVYMLEDVKYRILKMMHEDN